MSQITNAPNCVTNATLRRDLNILTIEEGVKKFGANYSKKLDDHPNILATALKHDVAYRRLKRILPSDLF